VPTYQGVLEALAEETRRQILGILQAGPAGVASLAERLPVSRPAVSQHLRVLRENGLVTYESAGTSNVYRLDTAGLESLRQWLDGFWDAALSSFTAYAELTHRKEQQP
jgi:DNA-binding transcriptional ArsR family regulator